MKIRHLLVQFTFLSLIFILACNTEQSRQSYKNQIDSLEQNVDRFIAANNQQQLKETSRQLTQLYEESAHNYPKDSLAVQYLFKSAMLQTDVLKNHKRALSLLQQIRREYPDHERAEKALFLIGYTYSEKMKNLEKAKSVYETFLKQYPESELVSSVKFELKNLGKPAPDLGDEANASDPAS